VKTTLKTNRNHTTRNVIGFVFQSDVILKFIWFLLFKFVFHLNKKMNFKKTIFFIFQTHRYLSCRITNSFSKTITGSGNFSQNLPKEPNSRDHLDGTKGLKGNIRRKNKNPAVRYWICYSCRKCIGDYFLKYFFIFK
jgi:hypothetical protein